MTDPQPDPLHRRLTDAPIDQLPEDLAVVISEFSDTLGLLNDAIPENEKPSFTAVLPALAISLQTSALVALQRTLLPIAHLAEALQENRVYIGPKDATGYHQIEITPPR